MNDGGWISVKERLPENDPNLEVLVCSEEGGRCICYAGDVHSAAKEGLDIAWQPLPAPRTKPLRPSKKLLNGLNCIYYGDQPDWVRIRNEQLCDAIDKAVADAKEEEREACAKLVETTAYIVAMPTVRTQVAAVIRARKDGAK